MNSAGHRRVTEKVFQLLRDKVSPVGMKRYGLTLLLAISLLVAMPIAVGAQSTPVPPQSTTSPSPTNPYQPPPLDNSFYVELIKIIGGSIVGGIVGFITCIKFVKGDLPEITDKNKARNAEKFRQKVASALKDALDKDPTFKQEFKDKLKALFVIETYELEQKLFEYCLNVSLDELLEDPCPELKLKRQFRDIINNLSFSDRTQIGRIKEDILDLQNKVNHLQKKCNNRGGN
jgi:hypothetical protein